MEQTNTTPEGIALARAAQPAPDSVLRAELRAILIALGTTGWPDTLPTDPDARALESAVRKIVVSSAAPVAQADLVQEQRKSAGGAGALLPDADLVDSEGGHHD